MDLSWRIEREALSGGDRVARGRTILLLGLPWAALRHSSQGRAIGKCGSCEQLVSQCKKRGQIAPQFARESTVLLVVV
jgi:hypothetical protein